MTTPNENKSGAPGEDAQQQGYPPNDPGDASGKGALAWMAANPVAANLLMIILLVGGLVIGSDIKQEVFPEFDLDLVTIGVAYPGASPAEVEKGVLLALEEEVRGIDGVKEVRATANESMGSVVVELLLGADSDKALADIKSAVDRIQSFPQDIERPVVSLVNPRFDVITLVVHGEHSERTLRQLAERAREDLLQDPRISQVDLGAVRDYEISIEVPQENLRAYGLTLEGIAAKVRAASVELPGGGIKTTAGEVLVRTTERREVGTDFEKIAILSRPGGGEVKLGDIATVVDGFADTDQEAFFEGEPAAMVKVFRVGEQTPLEVAAAVKEYIAEVGPTLPAGVNLAVWADRSEIYGDRVDLLMRNGRLGLLLVLLVLALFLEARLAFWVTMGIPISFVGSLLLMPGLDVSINMISLFAFIVTLGIVVDDAIVVGESIYYKRQGGKSLLGAAVEGTKEVGVPVIFSVTTTIIAFSPLLFVPGIAGKFFRNIPLVVICVLLLSLVESLLILPAHLSHGGRGSGRLNRFFNVVNAPQRRFSAVFKRFTARVFMPSLKFATRWRYFTLASALAAFLAAVGMVAGGHVDFTFMPKIDSDRVVANIEMPFGTAAADTKAIKERVSAALEATLAESGGEAISRGVFSQVGGTSGGLGGHGMASTSGSHIAQVTVYLVQSDMRDITASDFAARWRARVGEVAGIESLTFRYSTGPGSAAPIDIELSHTDTEVLERAATALAARLGEYQGVREINDGFAPGKEQIDFKLRAEARTLGLSESEMARQLRGAFFGALAVRQQRGRDEVRTYVRLPKAQRVSEYDLETLLLRTPQGGEVPLGQAADLERGRAYTQIKRIDGRRIVNVTADVASGTNANKVVAQAMKGAVPQLKRDFQGLGVAPAGDQRNQAETMAALKKGFSIALVAMFAVLAIIFRSYTQPTIIMAAIPFGFVGALGGHLLLGYDLSLISMMGIVALSGIVVNDSLVLIHAVNRYRESGMRAYDAVVAGGVRRLRPIILTSLTTFFGLMPMILEPSIQARFLIPMAISLGFGVLFATAIILMLVPALYLILEDARVLLGRLLGAEPQELTAQDQPQPRQI